MEARGCLEFPWDGPGQPKHSSNPAAATTLRTRRSHPDPRVGESATRLVGIRTPRATVRGGRQLCQDKKGLPAPLQLRALWEQCLQRSTQKGPPELTLTGAGCAPLRRHQTQMLSPSFKLQWFERATFGPVTALPTPAPRWEGTGNHHVLQLDTAAAGPRGLCCSQQLPTRSTTRSSLHPGAPWGPVQVLWG